jgi:hypothetical protein
MATGDEYLTSVIRLFPDYAESVIWFAIGLVSYDDAKITSELRLEMDAWEKLYYQAQTNDSRWHTPEDRLRFNAEGRRLAERLAEELGSRFEVEVDVYENEQVRIRSNDAPTNLDAAAAFEAIAGELREFDKRIQRATEAGASFGWYAYGPDEDADPTSV